MDLGTNIGLMLGFGLIGTAMMLGGGIMPFMDAQSALIVIGGTVAATMINQRLSFVIGGLKVGMRAFLSPEERESLGRK